jgi:hypothetical protein
MSTLSANLRNCGSMPMIEDDYRSRHSLSWKEYAALTKRPESTVRGHYTSDTSMTVNDFMRTRDNFPAEIRSILSDIIAPPDRHELQGGATKVVAAVWDAQAGMINVGRTVQDAQADGIWTVGELVALARDIDGVRRRLQHILFLAGKAVARTACQKLGMGRRA